MSSLALQKSNTLEKVGGYADTKAAAHHRSNLKLVEVPKLQHLMFVSPKDAESRLHDQLSKHRLTVIYGSECVGKKSLAKSYIKSFSEKWRHIIWFRAASPTLLYSSCQKILRIMGEEPRGTLSHLIDTVDRAFDKRCRDLLIFDSINPELIKNLPALEGLIFGSRSVILISQENSEYWENDIFEVEQLSEDEAMKIIEQILERRLKKGEKKIISPLILAILDSPIAISLFARCYLLLRPISGHLSWKTFLEKIEVDTLNHLTIRNFDQHILQKILAFLDEQHKTEEVANALHILHACAYLESQKIPLSILKQVLINKLPASQNIDHQLYQSIQCLKRLGLAHSPVMYTKFHQFQKELSKEPCISFPSAIQRLLREMHKQPDHLTCILKILEKAFQLNSENYNTHAFTGEWTTLLPHIEKALECTTLFQERSQPILKAKLYRALGRYFQTEDQFTWALEYYQKALETIKTSKKLPKQDPLLSDIQHDYGSTCLRIWEQLDSKTRKFAKKQLDKAYQTRKKDTGYAGQHRAFFTKRALARALKKDSDLDKAEQDFTDLRKEKKYTDWPENSSHPETMPLALMDLGVVLRLKGDQCSDKDEQKKWYNKAHELLIDAVQRYNHSKYQHKNKQKDLSVALSKLGELYMSMAKTSSRIENFQKAEECFFVAIAKISTVYQGQPSVLEARCLYRLARIYEKQERFVLALKMIKDALVLQTTFYEGGHPYIAKSEELYKRVRKNCKKIPLSCIHFYSGNRQEAKQLTLAQHQTANDDQNAFDILQSKGEAFFLVGKYKQAINVFIEALEQKPEDTYTLERLGLCFYARKEHARAEGYFRKALTRVSRLDFSKTERHEDFQTFRTALEASIHRQLFRRDDPTPSQQIFIEELKHQINIRIRIKHERSMGIDQRPSIYTVLSAGAQELAGVQKPEEVHEGESQVDSIHDTVGEPERELPKGVTKRLAGSLIALNHRVQANQRYHAQAVNSALPYENPEDFHILEIESAVERASASFAKQIEHLTPEGIKELAKYIANQIIRTVASRKRNDFKPLSDKMWDGVISGKQRKRDAFKFKGKLKTDLGNDWSLNGLINKAGIYAEEENKYFVHEKRTSHKKYGFRLGTVEEAVEKGYQEVDSKQIKGWYKDEI